MGAFDPAAHAVQVDDPSSGDPEPALQSVHAASPPLARLPAGQSTHSDDPAALLFPASQAWQMKDESCGA